MQPATTEITINRRRFGEGDGVQPTMTADDIAALVSIPARNAIVEREVVRGSYRPVPRGARLAISGGMHFLVTREFVMGG